MTILMANSFNWPNAIAQTIESYGQNSRQLFQEANFPYPSILSYSHEIKLDDLEAFLEHLSRRCDDPLFILKVIQHYSPTTLDSFFMTIMSSRNITEVLEKSNKLFDVVSKSIRFELTHTDDEIAIRILFENKNKLPLIKTMMFGQSLKVFQIIASPDFRFKGIDIDFDIDKVTTAYYEKAFRCPLFPDADCCAFRLNLENAKQVLPGANVELAHINETLFYQRLNNSLRNNIVLQVKSVLNNHLHRGEFSKEFVAQQLNTNARTLQYKLAKEGLNFKSLLESVRKELAISYLKQEKSVTQVAHMLGYTDTSNFCRAFKTWTGQSPKDFLSSKRQP